MLCADSGYHSEESLKQLEDKGIEAFIPDNGERNRAPRYADQQQPQRQARCPVGQEREAHRDTQTVPAV